MIPSRPNNSRNLQSERYRTPPAALPHGPHCHQFSYCRPFSVKARAWTAGRHVLPPCRGPRRPKLSGPAAKEEGPHHAKRYLQASVSPNPLRPSLLRACRLSCKCRHPCLPQRTMKSRQGHRHGQGKPGRGCPEMNKARWRRHFHAARPD